eukprot:scaffold2574_cov110-Isochrysis_galbana.AAC.6
MSSPVLILTGHFSWHMPSAAHVASAYFHDSSNATSRSGLWRSPEAVKSSRILVISLKTWMRCRGRVGRVVHPEVLGVHVGVLVQDDARVEQEGRVEELLHLPHDLVRLGAPLHLHEWSHVAAGAVLRLERATVLDCHVLVDVVHDVLVPLHLFRRLEALVEDEMQIALERVPHQAGIVVAPLAEDANQVLGHLPEFLSRARHVLEQHRRARLARAAHDRDEALPRVPEDVVLLGVVPEGLLRVADLGRHRHLGVAERAQHLVDGRLERRLVLPTALDEQRRALAILRQPRDLRAQLGQIAHPLALGERAPVEDLDRVDGRVGLER